MNHHYYLHVGPTTLPRRHGPPLSLARAMRRATGERYAVVYQILGGAPVPIIAAAGDDEIVFVPTGRRVPRDAIDWHRINTDMELWLAMHR